MPNTGTPGPGPPLAPRDLLILAALAEGELHGYGIIKAVEEREDARLALDPANLYRVLRRMRRDGWIRESAGDADDARRRTYAVTARGRAVLREEVERLDLLLRQVRPALAGGRGART
ncbi:MAG: PadR family transcriptional regulator [Gemmatimonadetes bacterium]|nr:PadR family transcriptional regulator [Gemmatimonadota bacterium]